MPDVTGVLQARYDTATGTVWGFLPVEPVARRITSIVIKGPAGSTFKMYRGAKAEPTMQLTATPTGGGGDNSYDSTTDGAPILIGAAEQVIGVWSGGATAAGQTGTATLRGTY